MLRIGAAVDDGQLGCEVAIIDIDLISSQVEDVAVKVENYTAAFSDIHYIGNGDIRRKLYSTYSGTGERSLSSSPVLTFLTKRRVRLISDPFVMLYSASVLSSSSSWLLKVSLC